MGAIRRTWLVAAGAVALLASPTTLAAAATISPTPTERAGVLKAFGEPTAGWSCLSVRLAASDHRYATVRFRRPTHCQRWAFNGTNVIERQADGAWKVRFEGSSYPCPLPRIPHAVQRDLGVCPAA